MQCVWQVVHSHKTSRTGETFGTHGAPVDVAHDQPPKAVFASASQVASGSHPKLAESKLQTRRNESWPDFGRFFKPGRTPQPNASAGTELWHWGAQKKPLEISAQLRSTSPGPLIEVDQPSQLCCASNAVLGTKQGLEA